MERLERKIKEQSLALELEKIASKQYILEEYLNADQSWRRNTWCSDSITKIF